MTSKNTVLDQSSTLEAPVARKQTKVSEVHGRKLVDDYSWLRDKNNPEVRAYLEAENSYTDAVMKPTEALTHCGEKTVVTEGAWFVENNVVNLISTAMGAVAAFWFFVAVII